MTLILYEPHLIQFNVQAIEQSFLIANIVPQAAKHNSSVWPTTVEQSTRKFEARADGAPSERQLPQLGFLSVLFVPAQHQGFPVESKAYLPVVP